MIFCDDFFVDGKALIAPDAGVTLTRTDLDASDAGRDESGVMHRMVVRHRVKSWEFSYALLTAPEYAYLQSLFADKEEFTFSYRDEAGNPAQCVAYCSNDSICYHNTRLGLYKNYRFTVIAC